MAEGLRFYLDEVSVKKLFAELEAARHELAVLKAERGGPTYTMAQIREELKWRHMPGSVELSNEDFSDTSRVCNWRNHVNKQAWPTMTDLQRLVAYVEALRNAEAEEWD